MVDLPGVLRDVASPGWARTPRRREVRSDAGEHDVTLLAPCENLVDALCSEPIDPRASIARSMAAELSKLCDGAGRLPDARRQEPAALVAMIESALA
jgi:hypothetical protein